MYERRGAIWPPMGRLAWPGKKKKGRLAYSANYTFIFPNCPRLPAPPPPPFVLPFECPSNSGRAKLGMSSHGLPISPFLFPLRVLLILPAFLSVLRPSPDPLSTSSSSSFVNGHFSSSVLLANALPISMLNSMTRFYPLNSLANNQRAMEEQFENDQLNKAGEKESTPEEPSLNFGRLKLCPPGGRSFFEAFELACPMKKRRRKKRHTMFGFGRAPTLAFVREMALDHGDIDRRSGKNAGGHETVQQRERGEYRPADITELMQICCTRGCEFGDLLPHCGPFSMW